MIAVLFQAVEEWIALGLVVSFMACFLFGFWCGLKRANAIQRKIDMERFERLFLKE